MKHALLVATFAASTVFSVAQKPAVSPNSSLMFSSKATALKQSVDPKRSEATLGAQFTRVLQLEFVGTQLHYWPFGVVSNDIFVYDPASNTLNLARNRALFPNGTFSGMEVGVLRSTNFGVSWNLDVVQTITGLVGNPILGLVNNQGLTDASKLPLSIHAVDYKFLPNNRVGEDGSSLWNRTDAGAYRLPLTDQAPPGDGYVYERGDLYTDNVNGVVNFAGYLNPSPTAQYGAYGFLNFSLLIEDFVQAPTIPSAWALDKWAPSNAIDRTPNAPMLIEGDQDGNLYAAFNNLTSEADAVRSVQVMKSTDNGITWGPMNEMPSSLLTQFVTSRGGDFAYQPDPFSGGDFLVTAPDEYSFFYRVGTAVLSVTDPTRLDTVLSYSVVEASYKGGSWTMTEVADLQTFNFQFYIALDSVSTAIGAPAIAVDDNGRGAEIQAARTADGKSIVVKYVDINPDRAQNTFPPIRVFDVQANGTANELDPLTSVFDTDIFLVKRARTSSTWGAKVNVSDDASMNFRTYMPKIVPDTNNVPILRMLGMAVTGLPTAVTQMMFTDGATVEFASSGVVSVEDEKSYTFRFGSIAPNPVMSTAEVSFTLDKAASVGIEVYDMLGNQLQSIATQSMTAGMHGVNVDATAFSAGTYHVALVVDGVRIMKPFIVVR